MLKILDPNELNSEIAIVVGTRPGIIKFSPVIRAFVDNSIPFFIIHTGQHYSYNMDRKFFEDLELPKPQYTNDKVRNETFHGAQTGEMIKGIESALLASKPRAVIVGGDANTNLAGALAARKLGLYLFHMEAGLRSHDWRMPEEHNRVMIDHISDILLAPTEGAKKNLIEDNVKGKIYVVGNTVVDAVYQNTKIAEVKSAILKDMKLNRKYYFLITVHREETVDNEKILTNLVENIKEITSTYQFETVFPIHPRTKKRMEQYGLWQRTTEFDGIRIIEPVGYLDFISLLKNAAIVLTDSGGIQEEACILRIPCITLRENTERPETVEIGSNKLVGANLSKTHSAIDQYLQMRFFYWDNPFGDGQAAKRIASIVKNRLH